LIFCLHTDTMASKQQTHNLDQIMQNVHSTSDLEDFMNYYDLDDQEKQECRTEWQQCCQGKSGKEHKLSSDSCLRRILEKQANFRNREPWQQGLGRQGISGQQGISGTSDIQGQGQGQGQGLSQGQGLGQGQLHEQGRRTTEQQSAEQQQQPVQQQRA
jgi:hypothetical protein